jgi:tetratricopeptide (TPR) repeat protein
MAKIKITKQDLKQDEVKSFGMKVGHYFQENYTFIIIILAVVVVGMIGLKLYQYRRAIVLRESNGLFMRVLNQYERGVMTADDQARRREFLEGSITTAEQLLRDFPSAKIARPTLYLEGNAYYLLNDYDQAITIFQQYVESARDNMDQAKGNIALGNCFENKFFYEQTDQGVLEQAMRAYERAINQAGESYLKYEAMLNKARLVELKGEKEEALAIYEDVMEAREFVVDDFNQRMAEIEELEQAKRDVPFEKQILKQVNEALTIFTFYKTAELEISRLKGQNI